MKKIILILAALTLIVLTLVYAILFHQSMDITKAHGMVDLQDSLLSFERPGRIVELSADEGQQVAQGTILAKLDTQNIDHLMRIQAAQCKAEHALLAQYKEGYLPEERARAEAVMKRTQATVDLAKITYERNADLIRTRSVSKQEYDKAQASYEEALAAFHEAKAAFDLYERGYRQEIIDAQEAKLSACEAQLNYLRYQNEEQGVLRAPFTGTIRTRTHEISDFIQAGEPLFSLTDENHKKIRIYLSREQLNLIKIDQKVVVATEPYLLQGRISFISPSAMFTPKTVQTEELRADLVYEVSVDVVDSQHVLRFGEAVTVFLTTAETTVPDIEIITSHSHAQE